MAGASLPGMHTQAQEQLVRGVDFLPLPGDELQLPAPPASLCPIPEGSGYPGERAGRAGPGAKAIQISRMPGRGQEGVETAAALARSSQVTALPAPSPLGLLCG